jgi:alpha-D-xyloside xylohydrolase
MLLLVAFAILVVVANANVSLQLTIGAEKVQIDPWGENSLRVRIGPTGDIVNIPEIQALLPNPPKTTTLSEIPSPNAISNGNIRADVSADGYITFTRVSDNVVLLKELYHSFVPNSDKLYSAKLRFASRPNEGIYGLGEHRTGHLQNKPFYHDFQRSQVYSYSIGADISIPFYQSTAGYGFLWNIPAFGYIDINNDYTEWAANSSQQIDYWVTTTNVQVTYSPYGDLLSHYVDAVGHPPILPEYASGFWQCKDRYRNQTQILDVAQGYYSRNLPVDVIIIDWQHWIHLGDYSFNPACWPDPSSLVSELRNHGTRTMVSIWPLVEGSSKNYDTMKNDGYFVHDASGNQPAFHAGTYIYDPFNADARKFVWTQVKAGYYDNGIKMYWLDADEPERFTPDQSGQYYYKLGRDLQVGMAFPLMHQQTFFDGLHSVGETDVLLLSRNAWAGTQRLGAAVWSGDVHSTFDELSLQVRVAQNMAMSGIYWWTTDIGGYAGGNIEDPVFQELIVRWFQFGAFCPIFRLHGHRQPEDPPSQCGGSGGFNEVWKFGDTAYNVISKVILLREQLRGYIMDQMKLAASQGIPVLRPIFYDFPNDQNAYAAEDQFMFGPDWLVAPVLTYQAKSRSVYLPPLPPRQVWTHFYTNQDFAFGKVTVPTPIDSFPLFFRRQVPMINYVPAIQFFSKERNDSVLCLSSACLAANCPSCDGAYVESRVEGYALQASDVTGTIPLTVFFSPKFSDNFVSSGTNPPDTSYTISLTDGYVFSNNGQGLIPLDLFHNTATNHHVTVASAAGHDWAKNNGFVFVSTQGYIFANRPS